MLFLRWFAISLFCLPLVLFAADKPVSQNDFAHAREVIQLKLDATQSGIQKDNQAAIARMDTQDKRIEDVKWRIDIASTTLALGGLLLTALAVIAGFVGFFSVSSRAKEEAQRVATETVEKMIGEHHQELDQALSNFRLKADEKIADLDRYINLQRQRIQDEALPEITEIQEKMQAGFESFHAISTEYKRQIDEFQSNIANKKPGSVISSLQRAVLDLEHEPESEYGFHEWNTRAFAAYKNGDLEGAARYWKKAAQSGNAAEIQVSQSLNNVGIALREQGRLEETIVIYSDVITRFGEACDPALYEQVAQAMGNKGVALSKLQCSEEAIIAYDEVIARFSGTSALPLRKVVARAMLNKGTALSQLQRNEEEIVVYDQIVAHFGDDPDPALREMVATAMLYKGISFHQLQSSEEDTTIYDQVIARFGNAPELALREQVAKALLNKGIVLSKFQRNEEAIAVYDQIIARYSEASEPALREQIVKAMLNKSIALDQLQRSEEAIAIYNEVIASFGDIPEPNFRALVAGAQNGKGFGLLRLAKQNWLDELSRNQWLQEAQQLFAQALEHNSDKGMVLGNQAYCAHLLDQADQVRELLRQALTAGGEKLYLDTLGDLDIYPAPPDIKFRALLEEVWAEVQKSNHSSDQAKQ